MSLFIKRHKFLSLSFLILIILIPVLVFAYNTRLEGYRVDGNSYMDGISYTESNGAVSFPMVAIQNDSPNDLFVPTKTWTEWSAFLSGRPSGVSIKDYCGGGACETATENCSNCEEDCEPCAPVCGDGTCNGTETCSTCPTDCLFCLPFCGDGFCDDITGENNSNCPADCFLFCGDGVCNNNETSFSCPTDCPLMACNGDGTCQANLGESYQNCPEDCFIFACGDGICSCPLCLVDDPSCPPCETINSCPQDCVAIPSAFCGNGICEVGEHDVCYQDCGFPELPIPQ